MIVDAGRLGLAGSPEPLLYGADLCLLTVRTDLVALAGARSWAQTLRGGFEQQGAGSALGLLTVGDGRPYRAGEAAKVLQVPVGGVAGVGRAHRGRVLPRAGPAATVRPDAAGAVAALDR